MSEDMEMVRHCGDCDTTFPMSALHQCGGVRDVETIKALVRRITAIEDHLNMPNQPKETASNE